jgi:hypothetical protein
VPERTQLLGYDSFRFGMSEHEIRKEITIADPRRVSTGGVSWKATKPVRFADSPFVPRFLLEDGGLSRIYLVRFAKVKGETCKGEMERLLWHVAKRHGAPDAPPAKQGQKEIYRAIFTFADGGSIEVETLFDEMNKIICLETVVYERSPRAS